MACNGPAQVLEFLESCGDIKLMEVGLHHLHKACTSSKQLCRWVAAACKEASV